MIFVPCLDELARLAEGKNSVEHNRADDQHTDDRPLPEVGYSEDGKGAIDGEQQVCTERSPPKCPAATEDGHSADHCSAYSLKLKTKTRLGIDCAVAGGVEDTREPSRRTAHQKSDQDALGDFQPVELSRPRVRTDRVEFPAAARVLHVPGSDNQHHHGNHSQHWNSQDRLRSQSQKGPW